MGSNKDLRAVVAAVGEYVQYLKDDGVTDVAVSREAAMELGRAAAAPTRASTSRSAGVSPERSSKLNAIAGQVRACTRCPLHESRTKAVPGQGSDGPEIAFVGEAPGFDEDQQGLAFVGKAGKLLTKMIEAMGLTREEVFIGNILKCRPPDNRTPMPDEMSACMPYLEAQLETLKPKVIVALGGTAVKGLFDVTTGITKMRGKWLLFKGIDTMPTFHPAYLLRNPSAKREAWADLQAVLKRIGREAPPRRKRSDS